VSPKPPCDSGIAMMNGQFRSFMRAVTSPVRPTVVTACPNV
jgi:hypothetical protein